MNGVKHLFLKEKTSNLQPLMYFIYPCSQESSVPITLAISFYWVDQKFRSDFSVQCYLKPKRTFWPTQYITPVSFILTLHLSHSLVPGLALGTSHFLILYQAVYVSLCLTQKVCITKHT